MTARMAALNQGRSWSQTPVGSLEASWSSFILAVIKATQRGLEPQSSPLAPWSLSLNKFSCLSLYLTPLCFLLLSFEADMSTLTDKQTCGTTERGFF